MLYCDACAVGATSYLSRGPVYPTSHVDQQANIERAIKPTRSLLQLLPDVRRSLVQEAYTLCGQNAADPAFSASTSLAAAAAERARLQHVPADQLESERKQGPSEGDRVPRPVASAAKLKQFVISKRAAASPLTGIKPVQAKRQRLDGSLWESLAGDQEDHKVDDAAAVSTFSLLMKPDPGWQRNLNDTNRANTLAGVVQPAQFTFSVRVPVLFDVDSMDGAAFTLRSQLDTFGFESVVDMSSAGSPPSSHVSVWQKVQHTTIQPSGAVSVPLDDITLVLVGRCAVDALAEHAQGMGPQQTWSDVTVTVAPVGHQQLDRLCRLRSTIVSGLDSGVSDAAVASQPLLVSDFWPNVPQCSNEIFIPQLAACTHYCADVTHLVSYLADG